MSESDFHFQVHKASDSEGYSTDHSVDTPTSEYAGGRHSIPQRLVQGTPTPTPGTEGDEKNQEDGYFPPIYEGVPVTRNRTNSTSRSMGWSRNEIYGDMPDGEVELARQQTRDTVRSKVAASGAITYNEEALSMFGGANGEADGSEFKDLDPELVTWDGPDDPENPRNWETSRKWITTGLVGLYTTVSPLSSSILSPAVPKVADYLHIDNTVLQSFTVSIFILAWVICPLFLAPISEMYGRKPVLNISIVLLLIFNIACGLSKTTAQLLVFRFLAGCAGAPPLSVGAAALHDLFEDSERNTPMSFYSLGPLIGPVIAPIIAGFSAQYLTWQWVFWILAIINGVIAVTGVIFYQETYGPAILAKRAARLRKQTGNSNLHTVFELVGESFLRRLSVAMTRPLTILVTQPIVFGLGLFMAVVYGFMYLMLVTFPQLWSKQYHYSSGVGGLMYIGLGVGFMLGLAVWTPAMQKSYMWLAKRNGGKAEPEHRIVLVAIAAVLCGVGLIVYGQTAEKKAFWFWPVFGTGIFGFGLVCVFSSIQNYLIDAAIENWSASTVAAASIFRSSMGTTFPLFGPIMYDKLGYGWANTICGIAAFVLGIPFPIVVYFYGHKIRAWTAARIAAKEVISQNKKSEDDSQV